MPPVRNQSNLELDEMGWEPVGRQSSRVILDRIGPDATGSMLARVWQESVDHVLSEQAIPSGYMRFIILLEGTGTLVSSRTIHMRSRILTKVQPDVRARLHSARALSRYEIQLPRLALHSRSTRWLDLDNPIPLSSAQVTLLASALNGAFSLDLTERDPAAQHLFELASAALNAVGNMTAGVSYSGLTEQESGTLTAAIEIVRAHLGAISVQELSSQMGISRVYLHRVFSKAGIPPSGFIRMERQRLRASETPFGDKRGRRPVGNELPLISGFPVGLTR